MLIYSKIYGVQKLLNFSPAAVDVEIFTNTSKLHVIITIMPHHQYIISCLKAPFFQIKQCKLIRVLML